MQRCDKLPPLTARHTPHEILSAGPNEKQKRVQSFVVTRDFPKGSNNNSCLASLSLSSGQAADPPSLTMIDTASARPPVFNSPTEAPCSGFLFERKSPAVPFQPKTKAARTPPPPPAEPPPSRGFFLLLSNCRRRRAASPLSPSPRGLTEPPRPASKAQCGGGRRAEEKLRAPLQPRAENNGRRGRCWLDSPFWALRSVRPRPFTRRSGRLSRRSNRAGCEDGAAERRAGQASQRSPLFSCRLFLRLSGIVVPPPSPDPPLRFSCESREDYISHDALRADVRRSSHAFLH